MATSPNLKGPNSKLYIRMQNVARYRTSGRFNDTRVAELAGLSPSGLAQLIRNPDYIEIENALLEGRLSRIDEQLAGEAEAQKEVMRRAVPAALTALIEGVQQRRDLKTALACAKEILDRDPDKTFAEPANKSLGKGGQGMDGDAPTLPADIVASLTVQGNKVVTEIKANKTQQVKVETELPEAKGNA